MTAEQGVLLLELARASIAQALGGSEIVVPDEAWLREPGASFVTLMQAGELRGCIGTVEAYRPLAVDVVRNAQATALHDYRFEPLRSDELDSVDVEVSLLSSPIPLIYASDAALYEQLQPGIDGVILHMGGRRATFLPQVWEQLPDPRDFIAQLQHKAGAPGVPLSLCSVQRYTVDKWREADFAHLAGTKQ